MQEILQVDQLTKTYVTPRKSITVLDHVSFSVEKGTSVAIVGSSGSGKSTLLGLCAGLDQASSGGVTLAGQNLNDLDEDERAKLRNEKVGFIFQDFQLIPTLSALENVTIPLELRGKKNVEAEAKSWLEKVGLADRYHHYPNELSGGEQQRVSLARAFANHPEILFADEPTGNLDEETSKGVEDLIFQLNKENKTTLIIVTHDLELAAKTKRVIRLKGGHLISDTQQAHV